MRHALPRSLCLCFVALSFWPGGAPTQLWADEDVKPLVIEGKLAKDDPRDAVRKQSGHKVHEVKLEAGRCYQIDLSSKDFDPFLRLEDDQKKQLGFNDDIDYAAKNLDARLCFAPLRTGTYRLIVTSFEPGQIGAYRLQVRPLAESGKPVVEQRRLDKDSRLANGRRFEVLLLAVPASEVQVLEAASKEFAPRLLLVDDKGKAVLDGMAHQQGKGVARVVVAAARAARYRVVVTTAAEGESGGYTWRVSTYRSPSSAVAGKGKVDKAAVDAAYAHAEGLTKRGHLADAVAAYERVVQLAEQAFGPEHLDVAILTNNLAALYQDQGHYRKAEPLFLRSLRIREKQLGDDHPQVATALHNLAGLHRVQRRYGEAEPLYQRNLRIDEKHLGKDHPGFAPALGGLGLLYLGEGFHARAEPLLRRALDLVERHLGKDHPQVAFGLNNLAMLYQAQGQYGRAEPLYLRSVGIREQRLGKDHPGVATALNNLATLYQDWGRYGKAEPLFERSLGIRERQLGEGHPLVAESLNNLAGLQQALGRYGKAEPLYRRSLEIRVKQFGEDHPDVAASLNNLATLYVAQGRHEKAEALHRRSLEIREQQLGKDHLLVAESLNNLAVVLEAQSQYAKAERAFERSLAIREQQLGKDHPDVAITLNNLAELYRATGQDARAEPLLQRCLEVREKQLGKDHPLVALSLNNLAGLYQERGQYDKAEPLLTRGLRIWEKQLGKDHPRTATALDNLTIQYVLQERWQAATEATDQSRRARRQHLTRELAALPERDQLTFLQTKALRGFHGALSLAWLLREREAVRRSSSAWLVNGQALAHEALAEQVLLQRDSAGEPWAPLAAELQEARRQLAALAAQAPPPQKLDAQHQLLAELAAREEDLARRVAQHAGRGRGAAVWLGLDELRKALPADTALVALVRFPVFPFKAMGKEAKWGPPRYAAWVIDVKGVQIVDLGPAAAIEQEVQALGRELSAERALKGIKGEGEPAAEKLLRRRLDAVARRVLHPLLPHVKDRERWLVCPDGALWLVPWAALTLPDGKYVVERHTVSYLVSGRDVIPVDYKGKPSAPVVLADPDFDLAPGKKGGGKRVPGDEQAVTLRQVVALGATRFARLPGTAAEAKRIAPQLAAYAGVAPKVHTDADATEAAFKALKHPRVLVLATHGFFLADVERTPDADFLKVERPRRQGKPEENPLLRSGLALAGANARATAAERGVDDGILTALEIIGTDLRGTELVVLSACETGLGEVRNGEGVAGLRQAFQLAGAQSVLATFWQIPDRQTAQLMGKFFDHLAAGRGRADALRLAQLEVIRLRRQREGAAHPFYWAAFTLTGNWR